MPIGTTQPKKPRHLGVWKASRFFCALLALVFVFSSVPNVTAVTQSQINSLKEQKKEITSSKQALQEKITAIQNDKAQAAQKKSLLEQQIEAIRQDLNVTNNLIAQYDQDIADKAVELENAKAEEARYYDLFCERVRDMEEYGDVSYWAVLFNSSDFSDLLDRINMIGEIMDHDNQVMDQLAVARAAVATAKDQLETARAEQQEAKQSLEASHAELKKQEAAVDALVAEMKAKESEYKDKIDELSEDLTDLSGDIAAAERQYAAQIEAARKAAQEQGGGTIAGTGGFIWPVPGYTKVSSPYGWRTHPITGRQSFHGGIDIPARAGTKILASKSGTVVISGYNSSYGNYVVIAHYDGTKTLYAHMKSRAVSAGSAVNQSQVIGYVGTTGSSTGNHLHFETWTGSSSGTRTNPMNYF
jgi:murein DD-endopeptidase MepM/ murein hydrolase activator NlpD